MGDMLYEYLWCKIRRMTMDHYDKYICQKKEKHSIAVGTVKIFIEISDKCLHRLLE